MRHVLFVVATIVALAGCKPPATTTPSAQGTLVGAWTAPSQSGNLRYDLDIHADNSFIEAWYKLGVYHCTRTGTVIRDGDRVTFQFEKDACIDEASDTETLLLLTAERFEISDGGDQLTYTRREGPPVPQAPPSQQELDLALAKGKPGSLDAGGRSLVGKWTAPSESGWLRYDIDIFADGRFVEVWHKEGVYDCTRSGGVFVQGDQMTWDLTEDPCIDQLGPKVERLVAVRPDEFQVTDGGTVVLVYKRRD